MPRPDAPLWWPDALSAGLVPCAEGEHGVYSARHPTTGRYLTDADLCGAEVAGGCLASGADGPVFYTVAEGIAWVSTPCSTSRYAWAE